MASAIFVVAANGWMNTPQGFTIAADGTWGEIDPWAAMFNEAFPIEADLSTDPKTGIYLWMGKPWHGLEPPTREELLERFPLRQPV